jgi:hypothetical protein
VLLSAPGSSCGNKLVWQRNTQAAELVTPALKAFGLIAQLRLQRQLECTVLAGVLTGRSTHASVFFQPVWRPVVSIGSVFCASSALTSWVTKYRFRVRLRLPMHMRLLSIAPNIISMVYLATLCVC